MVSKVNQENPDYGRGIYRRRLRLENQPGLVTAELEDTTHGFRLWLAHDGSRVIDTGADAIRFPFDTCPGATAMLAPLAGCPLGTDSGALRSVLEPGRNCTHLYDLAALALAHSTREIRHRQYDITVPDETDQGAIISVSCDGVEQHRWRVSSHSLVEPSALAGRPMLRGFYHWASDIFSGDTLEAALVLQRGYFVAQSRRQNYMYAEGRRATHDNMPDGSCFTYSKGVVDAAVHTGGMGRDFTDSAEQLLRFL